VISMTIGVCMRLMISSEPKARKAAVETVSTLILLD
jgi:hypothetical protein